VAPTPEQHCQQVHELQPTILAAAIDGCQPREDRPEPGDNHCTKWLVEPQVEGHRSQRQDEGVARRLEPFPDFYRGPDHEGQKPAQHIVMFEEISPVDTEKQNHSQ
jgi:hypothetical protein